MISFAPVRVQNDIMNFHGCVKSVMKSQQADLAPAAPLLSGIWAQCLDHLAKAQRSNRGAMHRVRKGMMRSCPGCRAGEVERDWQQPCGQSPPIPFQRDGPSYSLQELPLQQPLWLLSLKGTGWKKDELPQHGLPWEGRCWAGEWYC